MIPLDRGKGVPSFDELKSLLTHAPFLALPKFDKTFDRGKGVPSFDEMVDFALVEVDFDDPTTNVRGRRA